MTLCSCVDQPLHITAYTPKVTSRRYLPWKIWSRQDFTHFAVLDGYEGCFRSKVPQRILCFGLTEWLEVLYHFSYKASIRKISSKVFSCFGEWDLIDPLVQSFVAHVERHLDLEALLKHFSVSVVFLRLTSLYRREGKQKFRWSSSPEMTPNPWS